jgi:hypothetical protein
LNAFVITSHFIEGTITIFIYKVATYFRREGIDRRITIITISIVGNIIEWLSAAKNTIGSITKTVIVIVGIPNIS